MFIFAHLAAGLIVGKISGNYTTALIGALFPDLDHLFPYIKHKIIFSPKKFWNTITDPQDKYGNQRNFLHNIGVEILISISLIILNFKIGLVFALGYLSHILLDIIDASDFRPFYPSKINFKGLIGYLSIHEFIFTAVLILIFFLI